MPMEYYIIIAASLIIIISYLFNRLAVSTNVPSVLMLIILGAIGREAIVILGINKSTVLQLFADIKLLEVLGTLGLILIVLEAALELSIDRNKFSLITRSFFVALIALLLCMASIGLIFYLSFSDMNRVQALLYAVPLSIISSAIVIPSVSGVGEKREEFHIYESTFSDILGIMAFYFLVGIGEADNNAIAIRDFSLGLVVTVLVSVALSYALIYVFQSLESRIKLFLMISVLFLLFSVGKLLHLSSLLIILIFGIVLNNHKLFFPRSFKKYIKPVALESIRETFLMITIESAFVVRTFFFVIFGFSIALAGLFDLKVALASLASLLFIYATRFLTLAVLDRENMRTAIYVAPRGLITLLLFYAIPDRFRTDAFDSGILLFVIIISSLVMTYGLLVNRKKILEKSEEV